MDIAYDDVVPAYLESNQLIFEYENIGAYNNIIFPIHDVNYDFKPETTVSYNLQAEKAVQQSVEKGDSSWRLNPITTAQFFVNSHINSKEVSKENHMELENITLLYCDYDTAIIKVNDQHTDIHTIYLKRLIKQDPTGIWTIVGYDSKEAI